MVTNLHQKCKLQTASFMLFMFQLTFCITFFQNCCSCSSGGHIFAKRLQAMLIKKFTLLSPKRPQEEHLFIIVFALFALLAVPIPILSLHARIKILLLAAVPCIFRPQSPVSKNECMHRCNNFVNFVYDLLFSLCLPCLEHLFFTKYHPIF